MIVLVTGGAGFIGSHTCADLLEHGHQVVVVDNFSNGSPAAVRAVAGLAGRRIAAYEADVRDLRALGRVFDAHQVGAVIHFAARKSVGESVRIPVDYYDTNVAGTLTLLRCMLDHDVRQLVFSSSCSIYGDEHDEPIAEGDRKEPANPYARSKLMCEQVLADACAAHEDLSVLSLRYFNPVGAHPSGLLGEDPLGEPTNLMPRLTRVALGLLGRLRVFGGDWPTADGTAVRDYIHVMDVAQAHTAGLDHLGGPGFHALNIGTGTGVSVLELVAAFERSCSVVVPVEMAGRRPGDVASLVADPGLVERAWGWRPTRDLESMCRDAWRFQQRRPAGYSSGQAVAS